MRTDRDECLDWISRPTLATLSGSSEVTYPITTSRDLIVDSTSNFLNREVPLNVGATPCEFFAATSLVGLSMNARPLPENPNFGTLQASNLVGPLPVRFPDNLKANLPCR